MLTVGEGNMYVEILFCFCKFLKLRLFYQKKVKLGMVVHVCNYSTRGKHKEPEF